MTSDPTVARGAGFPDVVLVDGHLVPPAEATISAFDRAVLYGESLFETVKVVEGTPCLWPLHRERLLSGCDELGFPIAASVLERGMAELLAVRPVEHGALRVQVTGGERPGGGRGLTAPATGRRPRVIVTVTPLAPLDASTYRDGVGVVTASDLCRPLPWLKSGSYLASVMAKGRAEAAGAFECLLTAGDPPHVLEGAFSNVVLVESEGRAAVPPGGRLPGVTLGVVVEEARRMGICVDERPVSAVEARRGTVLLTGSLLGVSVCAAVDGVRVSAARLRGARAVADSLLRALRLREERSREERPWSLEIDTM